MQARLFLRCLALLLWSGCETSQPTEPTVAVTPGKNSEPAARDAGPASASIGSTTDVGKPRGQVFDGAAPAVADSGQLGATSDACVESVCEAGPEAPPATWSHSAWSGRVGVVGEDDTTNGAPFTRGDRAPDAHPARWPFETFFGPGAAWVDREQGYVYFFGVRTYQPAAPVRLARVRATVMAVLDHLQYEYWTGSAWQRPAPEHEYALAMLDDPAADLVPGSARQNNRPEISVAYNPYVGRFIMMLHNDATPFKDEAQTYLELWESETPQGPWKRAGGDQLTLPPHLYGPYMSEQTQSAGGRAVYFALSDWNLQPLSLGQPYVVGLWSLDLERKLRPACMP